MHIKIYFPHKKSLNFIYLKNLLFLSLIFSYLKVFLHFLVDVLLREVNLEPFVKFLSKIGPWKLIFKHVFYDLWFFFVTEYIFQKSDKILKLIVFNLVEVVLLQNVLFLLNSINLRAYIILDFILIPIIHISRIVYEIRLKLNQMKLGFFYELNLFYLFFV